MRSKIVIVTGGSSGLGYEIAANLARDNINACIVGRNQASLEKAHSILVQLSKKAKVFRFQCNVSNEKEVSSLFQFVKDAGFEIKTVFNVAGVGEYGPPEATSRQMIDKVFEANLIGLMLVSTYALREMGNKGGSIVNIMSSAAKRGNPQESVYCAAKWGARGYTEALKAAVKGSHVHVLAVYPGGMKTPFWKDNCGLSPDTSKFMSPAEVAAIICNAVKQRKTMYVADLAIERL